MKNQSLDAKVITNSKSVFHILPVVLVFLVFFCQKPELKAQPVTDFGEGTGKYAELFEVLKDRLESRRINHRMNVIGGRERTIFVYWLRDQVHVMKAMKYLHPDISSFLELFLERQTPEGLYYDYFFPIMAGQNSRMNAFDKRYWHIYMDDEIAMHRMPVETDVEYLAVEGAYYVWQATGDDEFIRQWISTLEDGLYYLMNDPLRWSKTYQLVKRGYTLDTWDFQQQPDSVYEEHGRYGTNEGRYGIDKHTPMGIMYGDNSGMYAASRQLATLHRAIGNETRARVWDHQAEIFRLRTNELSWNGEFYAHFVEEDPLPDYYPEMNFENTLTLSNPYSINRGLPTREMAQSIIQTYFELKSSTSEDSFAEWYGIYPPVEPEFASYKPGSYMNGGVNTIVAGELARAAFEHGYEEYGVDILDRLLELTRKHDGDLPVGYRPDGSVDSGIPDNWGQAAVLYAMVEGLAGVVDDGALFESVTISPRWMAAGKDEANVTVAYGASGNHVEYEYEHDSQNQQIRLRLNGDPQNYTIRLLLPEKTTFEKTTVDGQSVSARVEQIRESRYVIVESIEHGAPHEVEIRYGSN